MSLNSSSILFLEPNDTRDKRLPMRSDQAAGLNSEHRAKLRSGINYIEQLYEAKLCITALTNPLLRR